MFIFLDFKFLCVSMSVSQKSNEGGRPLAAGVAGGYELTDVGSEKQTWVLRSVGSQPLRHLSSPKI